MGWGTREVVGEKKRGLGGRMGERGSQNKGHMGFQCSASWSPSFAQVVGLPMDSQSTLALPGSCWRHRLTLPGESGCSRSGGQTGSDM